MDMNYENWDQLSPMPDMEAELKRIRKNLHKRNVKTVLTCLVLMAALLFSMVQFGIPALEKRYWDPTMSTYIEGVSDLELTMSTFNELFGHGRLMGGLEIRKTGFAEYEIEVPFLDYPTMNYLDFQAYKTAFVSKGELNYSKAFRSVQLIGMFDDGYMEEKHLNMLNRNVRQKLRELPEYVQLRATISFPEDLTMAGLRDLEAQIAGNGRLAWAAIRTQEASEPWAFPCGIHMDDYLSDRYDTGFWRKHEEYPMLFTEKLNWTGAVMEKHFVSMLKFSEDQLTQGTGLIPEYSDADYYRNALDYVAENGVKSYGCYIIATPQTLLELMDNGTASLVHLHDAWIGF